MGAVTELTPGVLAVTASTADGKLGLVCGRRAALAIDGGISHDEGRALAAAADSLGQRRVLLLYSHGHIDHVLGGSGLDAVEVIAHRRAGRHIADQLPAWAEREGQAIEELRARVRMPTIAFEGDLELELGDCPVQILDAPGHAPGAVVAYIPQGGVLFGSDTTVTGIVPYFRDGNGLQLEATLRRLAELGAGVLVPGHGPVVVGTANVRAAIVWLADYLARIHEHVSRRLGQQQVDEIVAGALFDEFVGAHRARNAYQMEWRHEMAVRIAAEQLAQT